MQKILFFSISFLCIFNSTGLLARTKTIYGADNRREYVDATAQQQLWANSTAAMINHWLIQPDENDTTIQHLSGWTLEHAMNICPEEPFAQFTRVAFCSGFLVAPDILVTAGHCISNQFMCDEHRWVFDFRQDQFPQGDNNGTIKTDNIYACKKIIKQVLDNKTKLDYAIIQLDRAVPNRTPLSFRTKGIVPNSADLVAIGYPSGIPQIIASNGKVRSNKHPVYFTTTLDTYGGNSGSPVINQKTGIVEGILVRGENDYILNTERNCYQSNHCKISECNGEEVTRITRLPLNKVIWGKQH